MIDDIPVPMCCVRPGQEPKYRATVGDTVLVKQSDGYVEAVIESIKSPGLVAVSFTSGSPADISADDVVAIMNGA